jgi:OOP family OmpA-OmpF porin
MESMMDMAQGFFGSDTLARVSAWLHESPTGTKAAVQDALPVSMVGLANQASTDEGSRALLGRLQRGDYPHVEPEDLGRTVSDPAGTDRLANSGQGFMEGLFGGKLGSLIDGMAEHAGVSRAAVAKVLGLAAPVVLGMVGKRAASERLDARGLRSFLGEQRSIASASLPGSLTRLLAPAGVAVAAAAAPRRTVAPTADRRRAFPWWLVAVLAAVAIIGWSWSRMRHHQRGGGPVVTQTVAPATPLAGGDTSALSRFLDGNAPTPQRFVLQDLTFATDSAEIEASSHRTLDQVAQVLGAHGGSKIRVEGFTDSTGRPDLNRQLSGARANATKQYLTAHGIDTSRIEAAGYGADRPVAPNDTAAGRAANRRTELVVTAR